MPSGRVKLPSPSSTPAVTGVVRSVPTTDTPAFEPQGDRQLATLVEIYQAYEAACQRANVID